MATVRLAFTFNVDLTQDEFRLVQTALRRKLEGADVGAAKELASKLAFQHQQAVDAALGRGEDGGDDVDGTEKTPEDGSK